MVHVSHTKVRIRPESGLTELEMWNLLNNSHTEICPVLQSLMSRATDCRIRPMDS